MSTPPTRSPGPGGTTSALPSLHENTTPRISSPLNPSPKPLPPPLPPPYQHTRAHAQTSSTEFPRVRRTSAASLAAQTQGHSPNGSPVWNMNGALSPPRQRFASSPATRQRTDSSPGSVTATRQRIGSSPCSPPHAQVETEATSFEALPVLEGFPRFRQGIQGHTYAHAHAQGYGNANAVGTGHSKGHGTQGIPIPSSSPLASSPFVGQSQLPSSSPVVGQSQVSSSPLWGQSQLSSSPFAGQIPLSGSSQGESRGNSPASVHSSRSQIYSQPNNHSRSHSRPQSSQSHLRPHSHPTSPHPPSPSSPPLSSSLHVPHTQSSILQSFVRAHTLTPSPTRDDARYRRVSLGTESRTLGSETLARRSYADDSLTRSHFISLRGHSPPLNSAPRMWRGGTGRWDNDWDSMGEGGGWGRGRDESDNGRGRGDESFGFMYSDPSALGGAEFGDGFEGEDGLFGSGSRDRFGTVAFKDEEIRSSLVRDEGVGLPSLRDGLGGVIHAPGYYINTRVHASAFHDGLGSGPGSGSSYPSLQNPLFSADLGDGFGSASVPLGYSRNRRDSFGDGYGFGWDGCDEEIGISIKGRSPGTDGGRSRSGTAKRSSSPGRWSEESRGQGYQSHNRHYGRELFRQQQHGSQYRPYGQGQEYEQHHSHQGPHQGHRLTRDRSSFVQFGSGNQMPLIADGLGDGVPCAEMRSVVEDGWGFEGRVEAGDQGGMISEDGWNERFGRARRESDWRDGMVYDQNYGYDREHRYGQGRGRVRRISDASTSSAASYISCASGTSSENGRRYEGSGSGHGFRYGGRDLWHEHGHSISLPLTSTPMNAQLIPGLPSSQSKGPQWQLGKTGTESQVYAHSSSNPDLHTHTHSYSGSQLQSRQSLAPNVHHSHHSGSRHSIDHHSGRSQLNANANTSSTAGARAYVDLSFPTQSPETYPRTLSDPSPTGTNVGNVVPTSLLVASQPALATRSGDADSGANEVLSEQEKLSGVGSPAGVHEDSVNRLDSRSSMLPSDAQPSMVSGNAAQSSTSILSANSLHPAPSPSSQPLASLSMDSHSRSHADTFPSLSSLGIGLEEGEGKHSRVFWRRKRAGSAAGKHESNEARDHSKDKDDGHKDDAGNKENDDGVTKEQVKHVDWDNDEDQDPSVVRGLVNEKEKEKPAFASKNIFGIGKLPADGQETGPVAVEAQKDTKHAGDFKEGGQGDRVGDGEDHDSLVKDLESKDTAIHEKAKGKEKHASFFSRSATKSTHVVEEQKERYDRVEKHVSLALMSILPASTIKKLSPAGEALLMAGHAASSIGHALAPVIKEGLTISIDVLGFVPLPGLEEAARALLNVWEACQKVDTNRLSCLRLTERCATLLYSVRLEIVQAGEDVAQDLAEPVERLCDALNQIRAFLQTQLHRPFLKRYLRREEISRELMACNRAITDVTAMFGMSIQIRTLKQVYAAANESRRFAEGAQHQLDMEQQMHQHQHQLAVQGAASQLLQSDSAAQGSGTASTLQAGNALGLTTDHVHVSVSEGMDEGYLTPPPAYRSPLPTMGQLTSLGCGSGSDTGAGQITPTPSMIPAISLSPDHSMPPTTFLTPTPTRLTFSRDAEVLDPEATRLQDPQSMETDGTVFPLHALTDLHKTQNASDAAADVAALRGTLMEALNGGNDAELLRRLQVGRGEIPEVVKTLRRVLESLEEEEGREGFGTPSGKARLSGEDGFRYSYGTGGDIGGYVHGMGRIDMLDREFMESGIDAMTRLSSVAVRRDREDSGRAGGVGKEGVAPWNLPSWTITRYEVDRTRKIGIGFFSDVYLGRWRGHAVAIKVLAPTTPRSLFVREINIWRSLRHPNVLPLYGASSAVGDRPWFFVSRFCSGGSLVEWLKRARVGETEGNGLGMRGRSVCRNGNGNVRMGLAESVLEAGSMAFSGGRLGRGVGVGGVGTSEEHLDLLRCMHQITKGMEYLHGREVLHGDLKAANVLVDENGQCVISDFGQSEMKSEAYRLSGQPVPRGTLRWKAPELLLGDNELTNAVDVYAFAICCVEILGMGDLPWGMLDDAAVASLVMDKDQRPPLPRPGSYTKIADAVVDLVQSCWNRNPDSRPSFAHIAASLSKFRRRDGQGGGESPLPPSIDNPSDGTYPHHKRVLSPDMRPTSLPFIKMSSSSIGVYSSSESSADEYYETASETTRVDMEEETFAMPGSLEMPPPSSRRPASQVDVEIKPGIIPGPGSNTKFSSSVIYAPLSRDALELSSETSSLLSSPDEGTADLRANTCSDSPLPVHERQVEARNERRYRILMKRTHAFHKSLTLPLWSPMHVKLGAVGYLSKPKGEFVTLCNALEPFKSSEQSLRRLPSMYGYGKFNKYGREENKRSVAQRSLDALSGFLMFKTRGDRSYSEKIARRYSFPLKEGEKSAYICIERTMYRFIDDLDAPKKWFQHHVDAILQVYAPHHPIQKEDLFLVIGALDAPDYALFVSHTHCDGQAHFNVFSNKRAGQPWGTFTTERGTPSGGAGPSHQEEIPGQTTFASKVSAMGRSEGNAPTEWDTLMLARLRFKPDVKEPTLL